MDAVLHHLRRLVALEGARGLPDQELLRRFLEGKDEAAFCALLERHGPMVLAVCRRVLRREQDAEDALQATFLVFVRQAGSIRRGDCVRSWLYGVACRVARKAAGRLARQREGERRAAEAPAPRSADEPTWREGLAVLDEELHALPEKYRAPILLCCLDGKSRGEAARELGWKEGAVKIRLERGRELLRRRLAGRGVALSAALASVLLAARANAAALPVRTAALVAEASLKYAAGAELAGLASAPVVALTEGMVGGLADRGKAVVSLFLLLGAASVVTVFALPASTARTAQEPPAARRAEAVRQFVAQEDPRPQPPEPPRGPAEGVNPAPQERAGPTVSGVVRSVDGASLTVRTKEVNRKYPVRPTASVLIDGKRARLSDLKSGCRVEVGLTPEGEVARVAAVGPVVRCPLRAVDAERRTLTVVWRAGDSRTTIRTFPLVADAEVFVGGEPARLSGLAPGEQVLLHLTVDQKAVTKVER